jgi:acetylornithine deacetylase/succinyl-diaminopimelate desuccinylase-like protein
VAIEGMDSPFGGELTADGRLHGRGTCDTKATFATVLTILEEMRAAGRALPCNLLVCGSVGEETGRLGASAFHSWLEARQLVLDELLVAEPTQCHPIHGHKGHVRLRFEVEGKAAHSSIPDAGANAIVAASGLVDALMAEHERLQACEPSALGHATLTPTLMSGGSGINIVPAAASVSIDRRVVAGESASSVRASLEDLARRQCQRCKHCVRLRIEDAASEPEGEAFLEPASSALVTKLASYSGKAPQTATYGTNAGLPYTSVAKSVVVFGPGDIAQAHQRDEWIHLSELRLHKRCLERWLFEA